MFSYTFDNYVLDLSSRALLFQDQAVGIEPKVFDLILLLIEKQNQLLAKEQVAAELWPGGEVSDAMLSRCVYQARKALSQGPKAKPNDYIKTQYGKGFYFKGETIVNRESGMVAPPESNLAPPLEQAVVDDIFPRQSRRNRAQPEAVTEAIRIGFCMHGLINNALPESLESDLRNAIRAELRNVAGFTVLQLDGPESLNSLETQTHLIDQHHLDFLLLCQVSTARRGPAWFIKVSLCQADTSNLTTIGTYDLSPVVDPFDPSCRNSYQNAVVASILKKVRACTGRSPPNSCSTPFPEAYRLYCEAFHKLAEQTEREGQIAQALLQEALEIDPHFADAWTELAWAYYENMWAAGDGRNWVTLAFKAVEKALEVEPDCVSALYTRIIFQTELGDSENGLEIAMECLDKNPDIAEFWYARSYALRYLGNIDESNRALDRAIALYPLMLDQIGDPPIGLIYSGDWNRFLQLTPAHDSPYFCYYRGFALWASGKSDTAIEELNRGIQDDPKDNFSRLSRALLFIINNNPGAANAVLKKLVQQRAMLVPGDSEFTYKEARLLMLANNPTLAIERLRVAFEGGFNVLAYCEEDPVFEDVRNTEPYLHLTRSRQAEPPYPLSNRT